MSLTVLLIQDDSIAAGVVVDALRGSPDACFDVVWATRCSEGLKRLNCNGNGGLVAIDAVLVEMNLPDSSGIETFERLFQAAPQVPILVISALPGEAEARLAVKRGAQDYLLSGSLDRHLLTKAVISMIDRARLAQAVHRDRDLAQVTLDSIGDAVISTDRSGNVTYLNSVAERLTGWRRAEAVGQSMQQVFQIVDATTREVFRDPMAQAMQENRTVALTPDCLLIRRDGAESAIEDSTAPIRDRRGEVIGAVMVFHDVSEARALSLRMSYLAQHDSLTDLPNRLMFADRLKQAMALADRQGGRIAVLYVDLDRFKHTNDTLGHSVGDSVLKVVADRLRASVRASDTVSRQGGDEFVVMLPQIADIQHAQVIARKILLAMRARYTVERHELDFTASIGVAIYPDDGRDIDTLLRNADAAMYRAKHRGRDNCQFHDSAPVRSLAGDRLSVAM